MQNFYEYSILIVGPCLDHALQQANRCILCGTCNAFELESAARKYSIKHKTQVHLQQAVVNGVSQRSIDDSIWQARFITCSPRVSVGDSSPKRFDIMGVMFSYALLLLLIAKVLSARGKQTKQKAMKVLIDCRDRIASKYIRSNTDYYKNIDFVFTDGIS